MQDIFNMLSVSPNKNGNKGRRPLAAYHQSVIATIPWTAPSTK